MDVKQEPFDSYVGFIKTESNVPVPAETDENNERSTNQQTFKTQPDFIFVDTDNTGKYEKSEQCINIGQIKQEIVECEVPKIEYQPLDVPEKIDYDSIQFLSTSIKEERFDVSDTKPEVSECIDTETLNTYCDLPTLKSESEYSDNFVQSSNSSKQTGRALKTLKTTLNVSKRKRITHPCLICHKNFPSSKSRSQHIDGHFEKSFVVCEFCGKFMTKIDFFLHHFTHFVKNRQRKVSRTIDRVSSMQQHLILQTNQNPFKSTKTPFKCDICSKEFSHKSSLQRHLNIHTNEKPHTCKICYKKFKRKSDLHVHLIVHTNEKAFKCYICFKEFKRNYELQRHLVIHVNEKPFKCHICAKKFKRNYELKRHLIIHTNEKPFKSRLVIQTPFKCDICSKEFSHKSSLPRHLNIHTNEKPHTCNICYKKFKRKSDLHIHLIVHTNEKAFKCDICCKQFKRKSSLQEHLIIHSDNKPFKCDFCYKEFKRKSDLHKHLIFHNNDKPFKCNICPKQFKRKSGLQQHLKLVHTDEKPFKCDVCSKQYKSKCKLQHHFKTNHS